MITYLIVILVGALLLYAVIAAAPVANRSSQTRRRGRSSSSKLDKTLVADRWSTIRAQSQAGGNGLRAAISDADKLLDYVMKAQGYPGETMAERLKGAQTELSDRNGVWSAHKLRNGLAHEVGFDLVPLQAREALDSFERALRDLGALK